MEKEFKSVKLLEELLNELSQKDADDYFNKIERIKTTNMARAQKFFSEKNSFNSFMERLCAKHDDRWDDVCYNKGYQPYPWNLLEAVYDIVEKENDGGEEEIPFDALTTNFPSVIWGYLGWKFAITHGQGSVCSVYKGNKLRVRV